MSCSCTPAEWMTIVEQFDHRWQFTDAVGSIDAKHIAISCPLNSGSGFYNYKWFFAIVLMAVVDADYRFIYCDVGNTSCGSHGGVFEETSLKRGLENGIIGLSPEEPLQPGVRPVRCYTAACPDWAPEFS